MDEQLYDQFGNYIGPQILSESSDSQNNQQDQMNEKNLRQDVKIVQASNQHRIVLHQDKKYYQTHQQMYPQAQILIEQQDRQSLQTPIIPKKQQKHYDLYQGLQTYYSTSYLKDLMKNGQVIRNICFAGHLHHGKTLLLDLLIQQAHVRKPNWNLQKNYKWLNTRKDQQQKQLSIKTTPISLLLPDFNEKHYLLNIMDTPGHPNFLGQLVAGLRICDGLVLVIDAIQGVMLMTQKIIKHCIRQNLKVIIILNKIDRLIIQMRIPPEDAYLKIKHILEQVNGLFKKYSHQYGIQQNKYKFSPILNNVIFASAQYGFMFSTLSMTLKYQQKFKGVDVNLFSKLLWGDYYYNSDEKKFTKISSPQANKRTFVQFVLQPIYKIFSHTVGKDRDSLQFFLAQNLNVFLTPQQYKKNIKTMIKIIFSRYFKNTASLVTSCINNLPSPLQRTQQLVKLHYKGQFSEFTSKISQGKSTGPLYINTVKMYHQSDYKSFDVLGRVISGTIKKGDQIKIMGENYQPGDQQDLFIKDVNKLYLLQGRYKIQCEQVTAGNFVLIAGIDQPITKTSTIIHANNNNNVHIMSPLKYWSQATIKVAIQPLTPSQLPKMIEAIRRVNKSYLMLKTKVQESGQHVLIGNGQMHLDCVLHDIRNLYSDIQVRISDPSVTFCQTVSQTSGILCYADTPNKKNRFTTLAKPLQNNVSESIQKQFININPQSQQLKTLLQNKFNWDILESRNIWSFGPQINGPNCLINDTLVQNVDQFLVNRSKMSIVQGFKWSTRQGPLCDQPMRNVKFRLTDIQLSKNIMQCPPGQVIPTTRRAFYSSFLTATPRLMQPVYLTEIQCTTSQSIDAVFTVLAKRRGAVQNQIPKPGTPHYVIKALLPCIEALGFQTDLRVHTVGQAFCLSTFDHWQLLPGDPLDKKIVLRPLQVHQHHELARQFMVKTRRRKGLNEQVSIVKYFDDLGIKQILKNDAAFREFL